MCRTCAECQSAQHARAQCVFNKDIKRKKKTAVSFAFVSNRLSAMSLVNETHTHYDRVLAWLNEHSLDGGNPTALTLCVSALSDLDRRATQSFMADSAAGARPASPPPSSSSSSSRSPNKGVNNSPTPSKKGASTASSGGPAKPVVKPSIDYGICKGYCMSIFFDKPCKRLASNQLCTMSGPVALIHAAAFKKLPAIKQASLQSHFDSVVRPLLSQAQVDYYTN